MQSIQLVLTVYEWKYFLTTIKQIYKLHNCAEYNNNPNSWPNVDITNFC